MKKSQTEPKFKPFGTPYPLTDLAAPHLYDADIDKMLATVTPETWVSDGLTYTGTMRGLANVHIVAAGRKTMLLDEAWFWAVSDLVFGGFEVCEAREVEA